VRSTVELPVRYDVRLVLLLNRDEKMPELAVVEGLLALAAVDVVVVELVSNEAADEFPLV
jgi:hypothetical protein